MTQFNPICAVFREDNGTPDGLVKSPELVQEGRAGVNILPEPTSIAETIEQRGDQSLMSLILGYHSEA